MEIAEFYEENSEFMLTFLFECYLLMIGKIWVLTNSRNSERDTIKFAFGPIDTLEKEASVSNVDMDDSKSITVTTPVSLERLMAQCKRIVPTDSESQNKWLLSLRKESKIELFLKFPVIYSKILQYVSTSRILSSPLAPFLVGMIKKLLQKDNLDVLRVEGLKMLLNLLKASSHEPDHQITHDCIKIFKSLININALTPYNQNQTNDTIVDEASVDSMPLLSVKLSEFEGPAAGIDMEMLNEIFSFITWDTNPDLLSTRFLYNLLKDCFLSKIFPIASCADSLKAKDFDLNVKGSILELVIDYLALWFLKSGTRTFKFGSTLLSNSTSESVNFKKNQFGSMVSLVVNDLSNFLGVKNGNGSGSTKKHSISRASMLTSPSFGERNEFPISSFLLEEVILGSKKDVIFVHSILKTACYTLSFSTHLFSIKLALEIFRSWLFNPSARRPQFLQDPTELDGFIEFYLDSLEGLFPEKHLKPADVDSFEDMKLTLVDRVDVYRESIYFFRAVALQAFFSLSFERWLQLLRIEFEVFEILLDPENLLERPFFTTEDALLTETLLGSLLRSSEYFGLEEEMNQKWKEASRVLSKCSGCRGVIGEWCRVIEALALLLVRDPRYNQKQFSESVSRATSMNSPVLSNTSLSPSNSGTALPPSTSSFSAWPDLSFVKCNSVVLFRNMLRILGDPADSLTELRLNRPDLMTLAFEAMERCLDILMKCRLDQPVKVSLKNVPPIGDFLPPALSALLHLKSYNPHKSSTPQVAHDATRVIAWKMVGTIMFRPMDVVIPDHYWGALLVAARDCLNSPMSSAEFTAVILHVGVPISTANVPGTTLILSELIDGILRFFNDTLWSGNSSSTFSASEASVLIPVTMKIVSNSLKLAKMFPGQFGHFRDEACLLRLMKMFIGTITDGNLLTVIHTALAEIYCSECITSDQDPTCTFARGVLELMMNDSFQFSRGKSHVHVVNCLCEYISALSHLKVNSKSNFHADAQDEEFIMNKLIEAVRIGCKVEEYSEALIRIIQGPLSDWILYAYQGKLLTDLKSSVCGLFDLQYSSKSVKIAIDQFARKLLALSSSFPLALGPKFIGSEQFNCGNTLPLLTLALTPSQTLLSFESDRVTGDIFIVSRNPIGKFVWKMRDIWGEVEANVNEEVKNLTIAEIGELCVGLKKVLDDSEFPAPQKSQQEKENETGNSLNSFKFEQVDVLKDLLAELKEKYPETFKVKSNLFDSSIFDDNWREQCDFESKFIGKRKQNEVDDVVRFTSKKSSFTSGRVSAKLRLLLASLSLTLPELYVTQAGFGIEVLKFESTTGAVNLEEEFRSLDEISSRFKVRIGCIYLNNGIADEVELFNASDSSDFDRDYQNYRDFMDSFVDDSSFYTPQIEFEIDELSRMQRESINNSNNLKKHLGNDSVLVIWHGSSGDTLIDRAPFKSDVTCAIIRIRPHSLLPGWYLVNLQTCYEKLIQPRKYARVRVDPFTLAEIDETLETEVDGIFFGSPGGSVQREGILVPMGSIGAVVQSLSFAAWRQAYLINCIRSSANNNNNNNNNSNNSNNSRNNTIFTLSVQNRIKYSPETVRKDRIEEIIQRHGMVDLPFEHFLSGLFQQ